VAKPITPQEMTAYVEATWNKCQEEAWQEHEPVAWMKPSGLVSPYQHGSYQIPLYTALPKREWVGLTDDEIYDYADKFLYQHGSNYGIKSFGKAIEAKLKEKNT
jgi:hypothetical protein